MFFAESLKQKVYVCHRHVDDEGTSVYDMPVEFSVNCKNVSPSSTSADLDVIGTSYLQYMQIVGEPTYLNSIKALDRIYVNAPVPKEHDKLARDADFFVKGVVVFPTVTRILLKSLTVEDVENG